MNYLPVPEPITQGILTLKQSTEAFLEDKSQNVPNLQVAREGNVYLNAVDATRINTLTRSLTGILFNNPNFPLYLDSSHPHSEGTKSIIETLRSNWLNTALDS